MITADDKVGDAVVLADECMPEGFAGTTHTHGEGEEREDSHTTRIAAIFIRQNKCYRLRIPVHDGLVDAHTGKVVNVAGLGHADNGVDDDVGAELAGGTDGELAVSAVHGVARLEGHDLGPVELVEESASLGRGVY